MLFADTNSDKSLIKAKVPNPVMQDKTSFQQWGAFPIMQKNDEKIDTIEEHKKYHKLQQKAKIYSKKDENMAAQLAEKEFARSEKLSLNQKVDEEATLKLIQ